jgi:hypothetical protein
MMSKSLLRTITLSVIVILAFGTLEFAQTISQTQVTGGTGGKAFQDTSIPSDARILEVRIFAGNFIDGVQLVYSLPDSRTATSTLHGGAGGNVNTFRLDANEYIVGISGRYGKYIDSLRIHTNRRMSPIYGGAGGGEDYRIDVPSGNQAVGFIGRSGRYVDALGLAFAPTYLKAAGQTNITGGSGGTDFLDSEIPVGARITEIRVRTGRYIDGIQAVFLLPDGSIYEGPFHGGSGGSSNVFRLEKNEYVTGISGRCGEYIDSLRIHTNKRTSALFGSSGGIQNFRIDVPSGNQAIAFTGRSGQYLDAIGLSYASIGIPARDFFKRRPGRERD